jgi:hypothetical protein
MMKPTDEQLDQALQALERPAASPANEARTLAVARARYAALGQNPVDRWLLGIERIFGRLEPGLAVMVAVIDLGWAFGWLRW